ncbi:MAG: DsbA family oxidoreductase [Burkholderiales bacterium]|nr:DsbA family oxidoreductase [Burkholderiales bacterium]
MLGAFTVDVVSDVVCPWCYIGKRRLEAALARLRESDPALVTQVRWHPFQLNPDLPPEGIDRKHYIEAKFGGPARAREVYARVTAAGQTVDIPFAIDAILRQPNTLDAHRLIAWGQARPEGEADALVEALFRAYFVEGRYLGDRSELATIAATAGFDPDDARRFIESDELAGAVAESDRRAREMGISGVPFFIFGGKTAVSGAQDPATLLSAIAQARAAEAG